ncbi:MULTISPECIES: MFS transporter [Cupriavidus]|uniref:MFS transporter n=1 Tax=Cupriavidus basilensis TaxID=68895 RepID=A0A643G4N9_9BURK|nr:MULTISPECIES: MFS transporter [Cupriavidus]KUE88057.1 hypothetical protein ASL20_15370 [Cupriavidus necator]NOV23471.1 MFS transporter [Cupriavidus necator]QOT81556.1 MFS transporter [Cupriavidus basilensis]BDB30250.1 MFS transporter [Cupriavidus sp. P-10]
MDTQTHSGTSGRWANTQFLVMAYTLSAIMAGATVASPLYPIYEEVFHIGPGGVTIAYTAYMVGTLLALLFLGHLSDHLGHIRTLRVAATLALAGLVLSGVAPDLLILSIGRFTIGVAAGIASTSATAGLVAASPPNRLRQASSIGSLMTIVGLGLGPLVGGFIAQDLPFPLHLPYGVLGGALLLALVALGSQRHGQPSTIAGFFPRLRFHLPDMHQVKQFATVAVIAFIGYTLFSLFASLAPSFFDTFLPWDGPAVGGIGVAMLFAASAAAQVTFTGIDPKRGLVVGSLLVTAALAMLAASVKFSSGLLFIASDVLGGFGQGLTFMSALLVVNAMTTSVRRAGMISSFFTIAYLGGIVPVLGLGVAADRLGLDASLIGLSILMAAIAGTLTFAAQRLVSNVQCHSR